MGFAPDVATLSGRFFALRFDLAVVFADHGRFATDDEAFRRDTRFEDFGFALFALLPCFGLFRAVWALVIGILLGLKAGPDVQPPHCRKPGDFGRRIR